MKNIHYSNEEIEKIRRTDMIEFFGKYKGFSFKLQGRDFRCREHNSLVVKDDKIRWYWNSKGICGAGVIDYLMKIENMSFQEAVSTAKNITNVISFPQKSAEPLKTAKENILSLPDKGRIPYSRLYNYLCKTRGVDTSIISQLMSEGKIYEDKKGNVVFVGFDEQSEPRFACLRGTNPTEQFRMDCRGSDKRYSFSMEGGRFNLHAFESPIDALSHASLENLLQGNSEAWKQDSRLSLGGTSSVALDSYLERHKETKRLVFCLDNDDAGKMATEKMTEKYQALGYEVLSITNKEKDFNDVLLAHKNNVRPDKNKSYSIER